MPAMPLPSTGSVAISATSGSGGGGTGIGFAWSMLYAKRMRTPRAAALRIASQTIALVSEPRLKSYCARSSVCSAASRNDATACAMSTGCCPPSVRVLIWMRSFIDRLVSARIGATCNFYREGRGAAGRRERLADYLEERRAAPLLLVGEAPGYRGARISGIPFTSERQLTGAGPAEATATILHRVLTELGLSDHVLLWNVVPTHPGTETSNRPPTRAEVTQGLPFVEELAQGRQVIAVGRIAHAALGGTYVRHPSHGGLADFRRGLLPFAPGVPLVRPISA